MKYYYYVLVTSIELVDLRFSTLSHVLPIDRLLLHQIE